jgi:diacylglycerol kinase family enzyme
VRPSVVVIVNASSGTGCPASFDRHLEERFAAQGVQAQAVLVRSGQEIVDAARSAVARGAQCVVAGGGDGTVSAVASQLARTPVALGVLPLGTLNHFAKDNGVPIDVDAAIGAIAGGHAAEVDVGEVNGRLFINNSSLGLYPDIVLDREQQRRRLGRGKWTALAAASLHAARRYPVLKLALDVDGQPLDRRSAFVFIGNNEYTMTGFEIGARARLDRGVLSLYVTQRTGRFGLLRLAMRALFHRLEQARDFDIVLATRVVVETPQRFLRVATDGEVVVMRTPLQYRIHARALRVLVPPPDVARG